MEEESGVHRRANFPQVLPHKHQVIIMGPDQVFTARHFGSRLGEPSVYSLVNFPEFRIKVTARWHVMKQRPDNLVGESRVELGNFIARKGYALEGVRTAAGV